MLKKSLGILALAVSISAIGAPQTPRHSKSLFIKQTIFQDGITCTVGAITLPATISNKNLSDHIEYQRQDIAAQQLKTGANCPHTIPGYPTGMYTTAEFPPVGLVDFPDLKLKLEAMYAEELAAKAAYDAYWEAMYSSDWGWICYFTATCKQTVNWKQVINNNHAGDPTYALAIMVRNNVTDYATLSDDAVKVATNYHMNYSSEALAFKQAVRTYLNTNGIFSSFVDIETEVLVDGALKRAAATMVISKNDTNATSGTYTGAAVVAPPTATGATVQTYRNKIDLTYTTLTQYPDFYNLNTAQLADQSASQGKFTWTMPVVIDPIMPVNNVDVGGVFDSPYPGMDPANPNPDNRSIQNLYPTDEQYGARCSLGSETNCGSSATNVISLMRQNNAGTGTYTYYGRWELKPTYDGSGQVQMLPPDSTLQENLHQLEYDLCQNIRFFNQVTVRYTVQRYVWKYDIAYDPFSGFSYRIQNGYPMLDKQVTVTNPTIYSSDTVNGFFQTGRDMAPTDFMESWLYDSAIIDPLKWSLSTTKDDIAASKPFTPPGETQPMPSWQAAVISYAPTQILKSNDLPSSVPDPTARFYHFNCASINEDQVNALYAQQGSAKGNIVNGSISVSPGTNDGDSCTVTYSVWESTSPPTYSACVPVAPAITCTGPGPEILVANPYTNVPLTNNACDESCPIGGAVKTCARPRGR